MKNASFYFGEWRVNPTDNTLECGHLRHQMEPRAMDVLVALCSNPNTIMSIEQLQLQCWGSTVYGDNPVHKAITQLRRLLGDSATAPVYIETLRKRGYRAIAPVGLDSPAAALLTTWQERSPFRGLQAFDAEHAAVFFGRDDAIDALAQALARQVRNARALLLVLGPSGSGKTSLVRAGLLPRLERQQGKDGVTSSASLDLGELAEGQLFAGLAGAMLDWQVDGAALFPGDSAFALGQRIEHQSAAVMNELGAALGPLGTQTTPLLLFIDRFEAVFTLPHIAAPARQHLINVLDALARSGRISLILACRNDFYPQLADYPLLMDGKAGGSHFDLRPPSPAEIAQIIRRPAQAAQLSFGIDPHTTARLDDILCLSACASPDALPLLQYTLHELYRLRDSDNELSFEAYQRLGGLDGAVGSRTEEVVASLSQAHRDALPRVLSLVVTVTADSDVVTSRRAPYTALTSQPERELVNALVEARLFVSALVGVEAGFGVAHEALLRRWDRVSDWSAMHRNSLHIRARLGTLTLRWVAEGRLNDLLLPQGKQLTEACTLLSIPALSLSIDELELITASQKKGASRERQRLAIGILILVLAVLAMVFGVIAIEAKHTAESRQAQAENLMNFMLGDFANKLRPLARLDLLDSVANKALAYLADAEGADLSDASLTHWAKALEVISEVRITRGDPHGAGEALQAGRRILRQQLARNPHAPEVLKQLGANAFWLGQIAIDQEDQKGAQQFFTQYRDYADQFSALAPDNVEGWIEQSYAHNNLGTLAFQRGDASVAKAEFLISITLKTRAVARKPKDLALAADLADSLTWAGSTDTINGELDAARQWHQQAMTVINTVHLAAPKDLLWTKQIAGTLQHLAALELVRGLAQPAQDHYRQANLMLAEAVQAEPNNRLWQRDFFVGQLEFLRIRAAQQDAASMLTSLSALGQQIAKLGKADSANANWVRLNALVLQRMAMSLLAQGQLEPARHSIDDAVLRLQTLYERNRTDLRTRTMLADAILIRADINQAHGGRGENDCQAVITLLGPETAVSLDYDLLDPWVRAHHCLAEDATVVTASGWLQHIGYREPVYLAALARHTAGDRPPTHTARATK